jgi:DNA-binding transcriptional LysR family regulator
VAELEARLGARLLQRTTRKLSLTEVGEIYLRHCSAMRDEALAADEAVAQLQVEPRGTLRISCPVTLAQSTLGYLVPQFMALYPQVRVDMRVTNRVVDLVVKNLGASTGRLLASPELLRRQGVPETPEDLHKLDTVAMSWTDGRAAWTLLGPQGREFVLQHQPRYVADDLLTLKLAMLAGTGMSFLPDSLSAAEQQAQLLVPVLPGWALRAGVAHAVFPSRRGQVPAVRSFLDFLGEHMRGEMLV